MMLNGEFKFWNARKTGSEVAQNPRETAHFVEEALCLAQPHASVSCS